MTNYLSKTQYRADKSRLTRAVNSGDHRKVIDVVADTFAAWEDGGYAFPDDWHRWERASADAWHALRMSDDYLR